MKKVTLVFYEYPAALHHIQEWEVAMGSKIEYKQDRNPSDPGKFFFFNLIKANGELLYTWPIDCFYLSDVYKMVRMSGEYHKTLIFGKIDLNQLDKISRTIQCVQGPFFTPHKFLEPTNNL